MLTAIYLEMELNFLNWPSPDDLGKCAELYLTRAESWCSSLTGSSTGLIGI